MWRYGELDRYGNMKKTGLPKVNSNKNVNKIEQPISEIQKT